MNKVSPKLEIAMAIGLILFGAVIYWASLELPEPQYEPLGAAALPMSLAVITFFLAMLLIARAVPRLKETIDVDDATSEVTPHPKLAVFVFALTVLFVIVMDFQILSYLPAGIIYLTLVGFILNHRQVSKLPWIFGFSVLLTVSTYYIFTKFFYIDLP